MEYNQLNNTLHDLKKRTTELVGYLNLNQKKQRLTEIEKELNQPGVWSDPERAKKLNQEKAPLENIVESLDAIECDLNEALELVELCQDDEQEWPSLSVSVNELLKENGQNDIWVTVAQKGMYPQYNEYVNTMKGNDLGCLLGCEELKVLARPCERILKSII